jgi:hypothetical protein
MTTDLSPTDDALADEAVTETVSDLCDRFPVYGDAPVPSV